MTESFAAVVICHGHFDIPEEPCGRVGLSMEQYQNQMSRADSPWLCPNCGGVASFDDEYLEEVQA